MIEVLTMYMKKKIKALNTKTDLNTFDEKISTYLNFQ